MTVRQDTRVQEIHEILAKMADLESELFDLKVIRSSKLVAEIGEFYASQAYGLQYTDNKVQKGYDLIGSEGTHYQVKCRRIFDNPTRKSKSKHLIKGLEKSGYDIAIIVEIGRDYKLTDMFTISRREILNYFRQNRKDPTGPELRSIADFPLD